MIVSLLKFDLHRGAEPQLQEVFRRHRILETAMTVEGCWKLALAMPNEPDGTAFVIGFWESERAYQRWMDHPERGGAADDLLPLMSGAFDPAAAALTMNILHSVPEADAWSRPAKTSHEREKELT